MQPRPEWVECPLCGAHMATLPDGTLACRECGGAEAAFVEPEELADQLTGPYDDALAAYFEDLETKRTLARLGRGGRKTRRRKPEYNWRRPELFDNLESVVRKHNQRLAA